MGARTSDAHDPPPLETLMASSRASVPTVVG